ncbi:MAG TPA: hypothetical protein VF522_10950 [Ramlibacter sp.]|uniref:hypothetical protein n=1 Tax=Ramlibacter sp. TaxID=1917967 RepID=UPI002ED52535
MRIHWRMAGTAFLALFMAVVAGCGSGCSVTSSGKEYRLRDPQEFRAYGRRWTLTFLERTDSEYYFFGITAGGAPRYRSLLYLVPEDGKRIELHDRIFALQRDGSVKRVRDCCGNYESGSVPVFQVNDQLVMHVRAAPDKVTDCAAYGANPSRSGTALFFGRFDPGSQRVVLDSFFPGLRSGDQDTPTRSPDDYYRLLYQNRLPLNCQ